MNYLEALKKKLNAPGRVPTKPTKPGFGSFVSRSDGPFQKKTPRPSREAVFQRLGELEPCSPAEATFVHGLEVLGWSRAELIEILNEDTMRRTWPLQRRKP
ncbi:MAG: hypothetical protein GXP27_07595 [Planctomycetes bacterium]|nr:hypothetical protein [Planctomycetota bacterium]